MRRLSAILLVLVGVLVGVLGSGSAFFAAARLVSSPWFLALFATVFVGIATSLFSWVGLRVWRASRPAAKGFRLGALVAVVFLVASYIILLKPPARPAAMAPPGPEVKYWQLSTGSRIAYVKTPAIGQPRPTPVIFLHGGPGGPMLPRCLKMGGHAPLDTLTTLGYDVYYYDQLGCGYSSRLDLRREAPYTVTRVVDDLEAIRAAIGSEKVILVGWSYGAFFASRYMLRYPERVEKAIFEAPAPMDAERKGGLERNFVHGAPMSPADSTHYARLMRPTFRIAVARQLAAMNSRAAFHLVPDWEVDLWWERQMAEAMRLNQMRASCDDSGGARIVSLMMGRPGESGIGFFYSENVKWDAATLEDAGPGLRKVTTPTLVLHPQCDLLTWVSALDYRNTLPNCRLVPITGAGHLIWYDQPRVHASVVAAFVTDAPLPIADCSGEKEPW